MYYIFVENGIINGSGECYCEGDNIQSIEVTEELYNDFIEDTDRYIYQDGEIIPNPDYEEIKANERKAEFESKFLATSKGNYRLQPKGYSNAQQSIDTVNGMVNALGALTERIARMVIFYPTPDFTKVEECTEEWLIEHQYNIEPMTKEEWVDFYIEFSELYALNQYKKAVNGTAQGS